MSSNAAAMLHMNPNGCCAKLKVLYLLGTPELKLKYHESSQNHLKRWGCTFKYALYCNYHDDPCADEFIPHIRRLYPSFDQKSISEEGYRWDSD